MVTVVMTDLLMEIPCQETFCVARQAPEVYLSKCLARRGTLKHVFIRKVSVFQVKRGI